MHIYDLRRLYRFIEGVKNMRGHPEEEEWEEEEEEEEEW